MSSHNNEPRRPSTPPSIPLRNLSRQPGSRDITDGGRTHPEAEHRVGRDPAVSRDSFSGASVSTGRRYQRIAEGSPSPPDRSGVRPMSYVTTPSGSHQQLSGDFDADDVYSPEELAGFQQATGFAGLSFHGEHNQPIPAPSMNSSRPDLSEDGIQLNSWLSNAEDTDTTPLNDPSNQQPISGAQIPAPSTHQVVRGSSQYHTRGLSTGARLGDDMELGFREPSVGDRQGLRPRSPSLTPLSRAGSMVRKMSQRVVNLSNEPEVLEPSIRRKSSLKHARLTEPPSFPAITEYSHGDFSPPPLPTKAPPLAFVGQPQRRWQQQVNPLKGKSLGIFSPDNFIRRKLCDILVHPAMEPTILLLILIQIVVLTVDSAQSVYDHPRSQHWGDSAATDWILLVLFILYTLEIIARTIVSGLILNPLEYSTIDRKRGFKVSIMEKARNLLAPQRQLSNRRIPSAIDPPQPSLLRSFTGIQANMDQPGHTKQQQRVRLAHRAFLRHSFNRFDFLAVLSFWIAFVISISNIESTQHIYVFRMLSCLRILRLLSLTSGTSVITRSLKKAAPLLVNVAFLIGFFWLLFAIIGVQSFKSSLRRQCVWFDPNNSTSSIALIPSNCGGYLDLDGTKRSYLKNDGITPDTSPPKGYLCPRNSKCIEQSNPYNGTVSFDNVAQSLQLVFVIMSSNTFSDLLYYLANSDYLVTALFFAAGIVILSLWLINLLVAVITSSFQVIREESKKSAFTTDEEIEETSPEESNTPRPGPLKRAYNKTSWLWILIILFDLIAQGLRTSDMDLDRKTFINRTELAVTIILLFEIIIRFISDWRGFFKDKPNWVDLGLAVITTIIQIPAIRNSGEPYAWLSLFQILRIYRVVLGVSLTRDLIMTVLGNASGLYNLIVFVFLITYIASIFAVQLLRGVIPSADSNGNTIKVPVFTIFNAFLGMYQVLSSENWTEIMYNATSYELGHGTAWISAAFFIMWFIFSNFIVLNMFIAVIQENFDVSEDAKRMQQVKSFLHTNDNYGATQGNLSLSTIFKLGRDSGKRKDPLDYGPATLEMLLKDAVVREFLDEENEPMATQDTFSGFQPRDGPRPGTVSDKIWQILGIFRNKEPNPFYSQLQFSRAYQDLDPRTMAREVVSATEQRKRAQRDYLIKYPRYNVSLFLFKPSNPLRKFCQYIVGPGRGTNRIQGVEPHKSIWYAFSAFIYAAIVAMVILACVTTPLYQKEYFDVHKFSVRNWFVWLDMGFAILFTLEALIKAIADGFFWTPNAYYRGSWGFIDGVVLVTLWINVATSLLSEGAVSRAVGAFKALRALRLLNVSDSARETFHSVIIIGGWKVLSAAFVSMSLLIPFAIYGLNLFNGKMKSCNDFGPKSQIVSLSDCVGEFNSSPFSWDVLAPRQVSNPYYDFDTFGGSLFVLFQIVSQEGWIDVMWSAQSITGIGLQPSPFASQGNAVFFVIFNLLGSVFVLTLFVSVFIRNYTEQTGVAFLTSEQRSWLELRKLLRQIAPSRRPSNKPHQVWRKWCYRQAVQKHGRWQRAITTILCFHLLLLVLEFYPPNLTWDRCRDFFFFFFTLIYIANIIVRIIGLSWTRFRKSSWDLYSLIAVSGSFATAIMLFSRYDDRTIIAVRKLFLVSIALLLIPRNNQLDQLFKTAAASLTAIGNLLASWVVLFLVYAIALTQTLGLTKFGPHESGNLNFRSVPKALILLFRMSCGEGWNQIMEDFASMTPPVCVSNSDFFKSDCGSAIGARLLFIAWNITSMYIFVSLFVSLIFESFSYVYQRSSGLSVVSREEIRRFKQAWATFDPEGTGFISKEAFPRLLGELSGVFEMRIYDGEFTVARILDDCRLDPSAGKRSSEAGSGVVDGIDLAALRTRLSRIPVHEIRRRRARHTVFYEEVLVSADPERGISFTSVLMILAHYNVISDNKSLRLEEFLRRRARLQRVEEAVRRNVVVGFFNTLYWSRRFRRAVEANRSARMTTIPTFTVPEIFVDDDDEVRAANTDNRALSPMSFTEFSSRTPATGSEARSENSGAALRSRNRREVPPYIAIDGDITDMSPRHSPGHSPRHSPQHPAWTEAGHGAGYGGSDWPQGLGGSSSGHERQTSAVSAQDVLEVLDNSAWGESIRRSFTARRPSRSDHDGR
ncbi:MAG: calcium channel protein [Trizodia sp. TS-e1964]|nr:MAG: calcium channel protein [Trizodia sp. TS-e1964]